MNLSFGEVQTFAENVNDLKTFYSEILGLELKDQSNDWAIFNISGVEFVLMGGAEKRVRAPYGKSSETVLCLRSSNLELDIEKLIKKGVDIVRNIQEVPQGKFCVISDPENNYIEIIEN